MLNQPETLQLQGEHLAHLTCDLDRVLVQSIWVPLSKGDVFVKLFGSAGDRGGARCCLKLFRCPGRYSGPGTFSLPPCEDPSG